MYTRFIYPVPDQHMDGFTSWMRGRADVESVALFPRNLIEVRYTKLRRKAAVDEDFGQYLASIEQE